MLCGEVTVWCGVRCGGRGVGLEEVISRATWVEDTGKGDSEGRRHPLVSGLSVMALSDRLTCLFYPFPFCC